MVAKKHAGKTHVIKKSQLRIARTFLQRLVGLIGSILTSDQALLITKCNSVHTCFMAFAIDVVFLDEFNQVVKVISNLKPWSFTPIVNDAKCVLELAATQCQQRNIEVGDKLHFSPLH